MKIGDTTFGLNEQALEVLKLLSAIDIEEVGNCSNTISIHTYPWYNGREKGFCISIFERIEEIMHIAVFEHRNTDEIHCLLWITDNVYWNGPVADEKTIEKAYKGGSKHDTTTHFRYACYNECVEWVIEKIKCFLCTTKMNKR